LLAFHFILEHLALERHWVDRPEVLVLLAAVEAVLLPLVSSDLVGDPEDGLILAPLELELEVAHVDVKLDLRDGARDSLGALIWRKLRCFLY